MDGMDLFDGGRKKADSPLADRMRPQALDDVIGQDHIVGKGRLLRRAIQADRLSSVIFYGPPGTGKTSLARVIANTTKSSFESLNAVLSGIKDIREAIDRASERQKLYGQRTILFVDEVHRWNKAQQDALLPWVENGTVILVGATTENPFFEVNRALVSRSRIFQLKSLDAAALYKTAERALADHENGYGRWNVRFAEGALDHLVEVAGGDARSLLNALELAVETGEIAGVRRAGARAAGEEPAGAEMPAAALAPVAWPPPAGSEIYVSFEAAEESIQRRAVLYDRDGDYHFDTISAFIKSVRGSDPDAALYWLAKMVRAGEDPAFIFRRMIILASEDVGLADPYALSVVISCAEAFERIGFPEGNYPLAHACLYLATAPKSNSVMAFFDARAVVDKEDAEVPNHLRDPSRDKESFGHGEGYVYPHAYREHWRAQQYLPTVLQGKIFYVPSEIGYEKAIRSDVLRKREVQAAVLMEESLRARLEKDELLNWSPAAKGREHWYKRLESGRAASLIAVRDALFEAASPRATARILIPRGDDGLLLWESLRRCPQGLGAATVSRSEAAAALLQFAKTGGYEDAELPKIAVLPPVPPAVPPEPVAPSAVPPAMPPVPNEAAAEGGMGGRDADRGKPGTGAADGGSPSERFIPTGEEAEQFFGTDVFDCIIFREPLRYISKNYTQKNNTPDVSPVDILKRIAADCKNILAADGRCLFLITPPKMGERISRILFTNIDFLSGSGLSSAAAKETVRKLRDAEDAFFTADSGALFDEESAAAALREAGFTTDLRLIAQQEQRLITGKDIERWFDARSSSWGAYMEQALGTDDFNWVHKALCAIAGQGPVIWQWKSILANALQCAG